ncbi:DnaA ATPase domain-containing protein [Candidatus Erwinia haradaeae]|uniref:DnaA ATPase domain-containing protein n=1 Tax=Candidatus Erwinia haradaeae TaxID=1922217 RepID=UPI00093409A2
MGELRVTICFFNSRIGPNKTYLLHVVGGEMLTKTSKETVIYMRFERFASDRVKILETNAIEKCKCYYCSEKRY